MMLNILFGAAALALLAVALFVWTVVRTAVRDLVANTRRPAHRPGDDFAAAFDAWQDDVHGTDPDEPVPFHTVDETGAPVDQPLYGRAAQAVHDALIAKGVPSDDLKRRCY